MVDRNLLREFDVSEEELLSEISASLEEQNVSDLTGLMDKVGQSFEVGSIVPGRVVNIVGGLLLIGVAVYDLNLNWEMLRSFNT